MKDTYIVSFDDDVTCLDIKTNLSYGGGPGVGSYVVGSAVGSYVVGSILEQREEKMHVSKLEVYTPITRKAAAINSRWLICCRHICWPIRRGIVCRLISWKVLWAETKIESG